MAPAAPPLSRRPASAAGSIPVKRELRRKSSSSTEQSEVSSPRPMHRRTRTLSPSSAKPLAITPRNEVEASPSTVPRRLSSSSSASASVNSAPPSRPRSRRSARSLSSSSASPGALAKEDPFRPPLSFSSHYASYDQSSSHEAAPPILKPQRAERSGEPRKRRRSSEAKAPSDHTTKSPQRPGSSTSAWHWYYKDPTGKVHGPWKYKLMHAWYVDSHLPPDLLVRRGGQSEYVPLRQLRMTAGSSRPFYPPELPSPSISAPASDPPSHAPDLGSAETLVDSPQPASASASKAKASRDSVRRASVSNVQDPPRFIEYDHRVYLCLWTCEDEVSPNTSTSPSGSKKGLKRYSSAVQKGARSVARWIGLHD
ncbi:hypothetical protein EIP91_001725 [Steccherinum ochraceum]|uniref:GYF domain-containing protein n=1 Tax=Steccherinum ochraceum TaxID=92696 RepID=A0A4R0RDK3_9APHY|nr:hypothetical protein EIP91_001725 [Steccherinum ochraceum]